MRFFLPITLLFLLIGCGFHLRGNTELSPDFKTIYVTHAYRGGDTLQQELTQTLQSLGVRTVKQPTESPIVLTLLSEHTTQTIVTSILASQLSNTLLTYTVTYQLSFPGRTETFPMQTVVSTRTFTTNPNQALSQTYAQTSLQQNMRHDVISQIIERLSSQKVHNVLVEQ